MRGTVAKRLRRQVYGEQSIKQVRNYRWAGGTGNSKKLTVRHQDGTKAAYGTIVTIGLRQQYQDAKKDYKKGEEG